MCIRDREKGVASMTVAGIAVDGNTIPFPTGKTEAVSYTHLYDLGYTRATMA